MLWLVDKIVNQLVDGQNNRQLRLEVYSTQTYLIQIIFESLFFTRVRKDVKRKRSSKPKLVWMRLELVVSGELRRCVETLAGQSQPCVNAACLAWSHYCQRHTQSTKASWFMVKFPNHFTSHCAAWLHQLPKITLPAPPPPPSCCFDPLPRTFSTCVQRQEWACCHRWASGWRRRQWPPLNSSGKANSQMFCFYSRRRLLRAFVWLTSSRKTDLHLPIRTVSWMRMQMLF